MWPCVRAGTLVSMRRAAACVEQTALYDGCGAPVLWSDVRSAGRRAGIYIRIRIRIRCIISSTNINITNII